MKCPYCNSEIDHIILRQDVTQDSDHIETIKIYGYYCPKCYKKITNNQEQAQKFMKRRENK